MATSTNRTSTTDNNHVMTVRYDATCTAHGSLGSWTATGTLDNRVPGESTIQSSATQAANGHAATCGSDEF